jgi:hypothetical protein
LENEPKIIGDGEIREMVIIFDVLNQKMLEYILCTAIVVLMSNIHNTRKSEEIYQIRNKTLY